MTPTAYNDAKAYQSLRARDARRQDEITERRERKERETFEERRQRLKQSEPVVALNLRMKVKAAGGLCYKLHPLTDKGIPDYLVMMPGELFFVETKTTGALCSPIQIEQHKKIHQKTNLRVVVLDTVIQSLTDIWKRGYTTYPCDDKMWRRSPHNPDRDVDTTG